MYPYDIDPREYVRQALAMQTPTAPSGAFLPQMTPASRGYYGPTHQALSDTLKAALAKQASNAGIFVPPPADNTGGLLSPATPAASFFRMPSDFSKPTYVPPTSSTTLAPSTSVSNTAQTSSGGGHNAPEQPTYSPDFTSSNGPVGTANGFTGPYNNGGGPGNSFVDGTFLGGVGNFFNSLFNPAPTPTSIDAIGSDRNTAAAAPERTPAAEPMYRLSSNDLMPNSGPMAHITGTPLASPTFNAASPALGNYYNFSNENYNLAGNSSLNPSELPAAENYYRLSANDLTPMPEPSQTLNGMLRGNYEPVTGYANDRANELLNAAANDQSRQSNAGSSDTFGRASDTGPQTTRDNYTGSYGPPGGSGNEGSGGYSSSSGNAESRSNYTGGYGPPGDGGDGGGDGGGGDSRGGPITKKKLFGNKPNNGDDGWGTLKQGEYVIRPESVKVLPPGLLSALNDIYKSPNPKKTLRGLLG